MEIGKESIIIYESILSILYADSYRSESTENLFARLGIMLIVSFKKRKI
jgi:hypothetical protein